MTRNLVVRCDGARRDPTDPTALRRHVCTATVPVLLLLVSSSGWVRAVMGADDWLRGAGKDLEIRLKGEVFERDGRAAIDPKVVGEVIALGSKRPLAPRVDRHRFEVWIPVNRAQWHGVWLKAASTGEERFACKRLNAFELRQAAVDGIRMTLESPTRRVEVKVIDGGRPVPGALVKAELDHGIDLRSQAGADGIARLSLLPQQKLDSLTAWTDDLRIGGFGFGRKPARDPDADFQVVELSKCRSQKLRFVDEHGAPVPGIAFVLHVATAPPDYNYVGTNEHSHMTTDAAGEATYRWFPDWDKHHFYADLDSDQWVIDGDMKIIGDAAVYRLKKRKARKPVRGRVVSTSTGAGGFYVSLRSFQGERERHSDGVSAFTDRDGGFSVDVLPDATYCAYALDSRWVSKVIDLIPCESASNKTNVPELAVSEGQEVEVIVTTGPQRKPYPNLPVSFRREHAYKWREGGETRRGMSGPAWWATTDDSGRATARALPGRLTVSAYTPLWRAEETVEVVGGKAATIRLHREVEEKRKVTGRLVLAEGLNSNLADAEIRIGSVDGNTDDRQTVRSGKDGSFSFETVAAEIGVFVCTQDGRAAGSLVAKAPQSPIALHLRPTMDYLGRLLGEGDKPLVGLGVHGIVCVEGREDHRAMYPKSFEAKRVDAKTDDQGNFSLHSVPSEMKVSIHADASDGANRSVCLDEVYLEPNESRPRAVSRLAKRPTSPSTVPLAERYRKTLRDCALAGFRAMVIVSGPSERVAEFVNRNFIDPETNEDIAAFMQVVMSGRPESFASVDSAFLKERKWQLPGEGRVCAYAIDAQGTELGRLEIDIADRDAIERTAAFVHRHAPPRADAEKKWQDAFAEAKRSHRRVWARVGQRYCGYCFRLARWLDDHRQILEKDYVMLKIDDVRDQNGARIAERLTRGKNQGVPFHAVFDPDQKMLIDSEGPVGNIGHPSGFEGKKQMRKMLLTTRRHLTDAEIDRLVESLEDH